MNKVILEQYGLYMHEKTTVGQYEAFQYRNILYCIIPVDHLELDEINEISQLSHYMFEKGEPFTGQILSTKEGEIVCRNGENLRFILVYFPTHTRSRQLMIGKELARFHQKGRMYPYPVVKINRIGQWKYLWEKRLDQMELFWKDRVKQHPRNQFETLFVESFQYYLGMTENAIQYLVDTELDDTPMPNDSATICHQRFTHQSWDENNGMKLPTDWVFDHASRDLAEYVRSILLTNDKLDSTQLSNFIYQYERVSPLTSFSWRLLYSRLLFPVHYFNCIEGYYLTNADQVKSRYENQLKHYLNVSHEYEKVLSNFHNMTRSNRSIQLPNVRWLAK